MTIQDAIGRKEIRVARLVTGGEPLVLGTVPMPQPRRHDVLVKVAACNVVPNVINIASGKGWYIIPQLPVVFGLDVAGTVEAIGPDVIGFEIGDRVYVDPFLSCGNCHHCRRGRAEFCRHGCLRGYLNWFRESDVLQAQYPLGGLSEYVAAPHAKLVRIPNNLSFAAASRLGYLGTSYAALKRGGLEPGGTLLINGVTGTLGVGGVLIALAMGAGRILGIGRNRETMARVEALAPGRIATRPFGEDVVGWVYSQTAGRGADVFYDCLGAGGDVETTNALFNAVKCGGTGIVTAGGVAGDIRRSYRATLHTDIRVAGSNWFNDAEIDELVELIARGLVDLSSWQTRSFRLDEVNEAFEFAGRRQGGFVNVVIEF